MTNVLPLPKARRPLLVAALVVGGLAGPALAGLPAWAASPNHGSSRNHASAHASRKAHASHKAAAKHPTVTVSSAKVAGVGTVLVTSKGRTLYLLTADHQKTVTCASSPCLAIWPPFDVPAGARLKAGKGVKGGLLATIKGPRGTQVTYDHWPLYTYAGDTRSGQASGQGIHSFGGVWWAVTTSGHAATSSSGSATTAPSSSKSQGSSGSYGGYGY
jgi:predicted lipoprotein with Yx(FWY)xxD motif